jgi:hypothetical protein
MIIEPHGEHSDARISPKNSLERPSGRQHGRVPLWAIRYIRFHVSSQEENSEIATHMSVLRSRHSRLLNASD